MYWIVITSSGKLRSFNCPDRKRLTATDDTVAGCNHKEGRTVCSIMTCPIRISKDEIADSHRRKKILKNGDNFTEPLNDF